MNRQFILASVVLTVLPMAAVGTLAQEIAGLHPNMRPAGAPVITEVAKPDGWFTKALAGVSKPYPASLQFLVDQGNWFSPFLRPGMTGPYDIRGWHSGEAAAPAN